jgi:hypothetical protein
VETGSRLRRSVGSIGPLATDDQRAGRGAIRRGEPRFVATHAKRSDAVGNVLSIPSVLGERCPECRLELGDGRADRA